MPAFTHPRLREIAAYLDSVRGGLARIVEAAPHAALTAVPASGGWSVAQIIQHLGKAEGSTAKLLEGAFGSAVAAGLAADPNSTSLLGSLDRFQADGDVLRRLVAPDRLRPTDGADVEASWTSLKAVRDRTYRAFATVDGRDLTAIVAAHPFFGPLNGYEWLLFLGKHEERHVAQIERQLAAP